MFTKTLALAVTLASLVACSRHTPKPDEQAQSVAATDDDEGDYTFVQQRTPRVPPRLQRFDANHDGVLEANEVPPRLRTWFAAVDANHDGIVTAHEIRVYNRAHRQQGHGQPPAPQPQPQPGPAHTALQI